MNYKQANKKYGSKICIEAFSHIHEGSSSIGLQYLPLRPDGKNYTTRQVDAMVLAYSEKFPELVYKTREEILEFFAGFVEDGVGCPNCDKIHSKEDWNKETEKYFSHVYKLDKSLENDPLGYKYMYVCPYCECYIGIDKLKFY